MTEAEAARIRYVLTDIDDTITNGGKLPAEAYDAMWKLHKLGYRVIPRHGTFLRAGATSSPASGRRTPVVGRKTAPSSII